LFLVYKACVQKSIVDAVDLLISISKSLASCSSTRRSAASGVAMVAAPVLEAS